MKIFGIFCFRNRFWILLSLCHILILLFLYKKFGFNISNEGDKYLSRAIYITKGNFVSSTLQQTFYFAYVIYLSFFTFFKIKTIYIFISTYLISVFSYFKFYKLICENIDLETGKFWIFVIGLSPLIQYWQFTLFSETFFIAVSLLFTYMCLYPRLKYRALKVIFFALITMFSRPTGIVTVICVLVFSAGKNNFFTKKMAILLGSFILLIVFIGLIFFFPLPYRDFAKYISKGSIYFGFPSWSSPELLPGHYTLFDCYNFIYQKKGLKTLLVLFFQKFNSFYLTTRAYYSDLHNLINGFHHLFYPFFIISLFLSYKKEREKYSFLLLFFSIVIFNSLIVTLFFNEWSERFTVNAFPFIILLANYSLVYSYKTFFGKRLLYFKSKIKLQ